MYYVYFLLLNNNTIYKGFSDNLKRRYKEHENGKVKSTRNRRPLKLIGYEAYIEKSDAKRREKFLKTNEGKKLFYRQYRDVLNKLRKDG
ncbi:MAG: excinuclease ABC subunit C [Parcubacteria group bacterium]|nr:excinuclease ABC subunit C [Parcubacteria group bacterium]